MPNEPAGLCALVLLGNQKNRNVPLTNLQVVELQGAVAAQKLATEKQAATVIQAKIDEKVAEELTKVAPSNPPVQPDTYDGERRQNTGTSTWHLDLVTLILIRARGGDRSMQNDHNNSSPAKKRMGSSMDLHSKGRVDIQVKTMHLERDCQLVVLELRYGWHAWKTSIAQRLGGGRCGATPLHTRHTS